MTETFDDLKPKAKESVKAILAGEYFLADYPTPTALLRTYQEKNHSFMHQVRVIEALYEADPSKCIKVSNVLVQRQVGVVELKEAIRFLRFIESKLHDFELASEWKKYCVVLFPVAVPFKI